ncbi:MAG: thioredoxin family protein [Methanobacteriaceae archaeon]|nr:thioredoxin family protein [Methanobacteriaceae archaeon]
MPYLICDHCNGYYELKNGESPEDFDLKCECGGRLEYYANKYDYYKKLKENDIDRNNHQEPADKPENSYNGFLDNLDQQSKGLIGIAVLCIIVFAAILVSGSFSSMGSSSYLDIMPADIQAAKAPVLVVLSAPRCPACRKFDSETMTNPDVKSKLSAYSVMRINVDTDPERAKRFNTHVIPTLVLLDANGKEIRRNEGYMNSAELMNFLKI